MTFYTGTPVNDRAKLVRLGYELQHRGLHIGEHPAFGGVKGNHIPRSKHTVARAFDVNLSFRVPDPREKALNDKLAVELMARGFGVISNRRNYSTDHVNHAHVETIAWRQENYDGRVKLHGDTVWKASLTVDGKKGPKTISALQTSMGVTVDGQMGSGAVVAKALQAFLNTEDNAGLAVDGKAGRLTQQALSRYYDLTVTNHGYITQGIWRVIQARLNQNGNIAMYR